MNSSNFITGVLVGAIAGLTAGILLAPDKGTETRRKIMEKGNDLADAAKNKFKAYGQKGEEMLNETENKAQEWAQKGKRKAKDMMEEGKEKFDDLNKADNSFS